MQPFMKYNTYEMAILIAKNNPTTCKVRFDLSGPRIFCKDPSKIVIPSDAEEQWYYDSSEGITNKLNTKHSLYDTIEVVIYD